MLGNGMSLLSSKNSGVSFLSTLVLGLITFLCVALIGTTGYLKYQLDRSEIRLAAPDAGFTKDQEVYEKTLHSLGYGGFLGFAQTLTVRADGNALADMRQNLKMARDALKRLPEKTSASARHDIQAIADIYNNVLTKAEANAAAVPNAPGLTNGDLAPAIAALPVLESRLQSAVATSRLLAQDDFRLWGLGLTLMAWCSLVLAAAMTAGLYLTLRNRQAAPLRALAQSVENLSRGDMQTPIWGMERRDAIGELARAVDLARYHFSQLPDLSLMSEQGPVRLKFEGETRSLFEAMMRSISGDHEFTRKETANFTASILEQQTILTELAARINAALNQIQQFGNASRDTIQNLAKSMSDTSGALSKTHERGIAQIDRLVPYMQERAQNMAEVTHIAGTKVTQMLQAMVKAENTLQNSAAQSQKIVEEFGATTNQIGERLFAVTNLMQASNKVLTETTDTAQSRFNEAVEKLSRGETHLQQIIKRTDDRLNSTLHVEESLSALASRTEGNIERMESAAHAMSERHEQLSEQVVLATHRMEGIVASFDTAQRAMADAMQQLRRDGSLLSGLLEELRANNDQLLSSISQNSQASFGAVQNLTDRSHELMHKLESHIGHQAQESETRFIGIAAKSQAMAEQADTALAAMAQTTTTLRAENERLVATRTRFTDTVSQIGARLEQQANDTFSKAEQWSAQNYAKLSALAESMESVMKRLDILGQLTGTLGSVAGQLGQLMPALTQSPSLTGARETGANANALTEALRAELQSQSQQSAAQIAALQDQLAHILAEVKERGQARLDPEAPVEVSIPESLLSRIQMQWHETMVQIEAMHDQLAQMIVQQKDQLETRLVVMDKKLKGGVFDPESGDQQAMILNDIVMTLAKINEHVVQLDDVVNGPKRLKA